MRQFPVVDILREVVEAAVDQLPGAAVDREALSDFARLHHVGQRHSVTVVGEGKHNLERHRKKTLKMVILFSFYSAALKPSLNPNKCNFHSFR